MTHPTDEELDALVQRLHGTPLYEGHGEASETPERAADAINALRTQLADARSELSYTNKRLEHAFERIERQARTIDDLTVRTNRAEAALAAQIEADAGIADALYRMALKDSDDDLSSPWKSHKASAYGTAAQAIRNQPHDRTALDRMLAEATEQALREAADMFDADSNIAQTILALIEAPNAQP